MRKNKKIQSKNLRMAGWFSLAVATLIVLSGILKFIILVEESKFDGSSHFTVEVENQNEFISFSPKDSSINIVMVDSFDLAKFLEIPVDVKINSDEKLSAKNLSKKLLSLSLRLGGRLNFFDSVKLFLFTTSVKDNSLSEVKISSSYSKTKIQSAILSSFSDPEILEEKQSVEIVNSADVPGLGNRLANYITNMGGNVILVTNGDLKDQSEIRYFTKSYTERKISQLLGFPTRMQGKKDLADIIITIGKDSKDNSKF